MSEQTAQTAKKRNRRKKKKNEAVKVEGATDSASVADKTPKQSSDQGEVVVTNTKCTRCKRQFRQLLTPTEWTADSAAQPWKMCPHCMLAEEKTDSQDSAPVSAAYSCTCASCQAKRETTMAPQAEREAQVTQNYWMEIRHIVRCIYRESMTLESPTTRNSIGSDKMRMIVRKLCSRDPHQFFQRLETLAREYLLEVKVRLLEQLSCGFNSPQLAIEFIEMLLEEYTSLTNSLPPLLFLLEPLEESDYVHSLGVTVEMMNKNIFRELIFAESFMSSNLPLITAQLRLASLASDPYHRNTADALSQRYVSLDEEMEEISCVWKSAKDHLIHHHYHHHEARRQQEIKADGNDFMKMKSTHTKNKHSANSNRSVPLLDGLSNRSMEQSDHTAQLNEWSRLLFKCIRPIGEPEFRRNGDIATHTITLRLDMTELDLQNAQPTCSKADLRKYRGLGMTVDEVVEVSMKLNSLKSLGFNLKIEDLFDEEGFSLSEVNQALRRPRRERVQADSGDDVYFIESEDESEEGGRETEQGREPQLTPQEKGDMLRAKERILRRQESGNPQSRQSDFLQGMTMKIRFMKRMEGDADKSFLPSNGGKVMFSSCDQVQMKLTQLELSSVRLVTSPECVGGDLGLSHSPPPTPSMRNISSCGLTKDDYAFIHTDSHSQFMDLLLQKRCQLDTTVIQKEQQRRATEAAMATAEADKRQTSTCVRTADSARQSGHTHAPPTTNGVETCPVQEMGKPVLGTGFTPVYLPNSTQPCQCSACVGAIAANITKENSRPLNPTDPSRSEVTIQSSLDQHLSRPDRAKQPPSPPASKEAVWRNWMSTSGRAQLESESQLCTDTHSHHHHGHHYHYHHHHHGDGMDGDSGYGDSLKSSCSMSCDCHDHTHPTPYDHHNGCSSPSYCSSNGTSSSAVTGGVAGGGAGDSSRRYCPCCYCELFGNNGPPPIPTSHNFTKQRDKMRHKLEEKKKKEKELTCRHSHNHSSSEADCRPLDELVAFIEGEGEGAEEGEVGGVIIGMATTAMKPCRKKKKPKKVHQPSLPATEEESSDHMTNSHDQPQDHTPTTPTTNEPSVQSKSRGVNRGRVDHTHSHTHNGSKSPRVGGKVKVHSSKPRPPSTSAKPSTTDSDVQPLQAGGEEISDDYDDELEAFKKICFAAPDVNRRRIAVSLDMNDLMAKMK